MVSPSVVIAVDPGLDAIANVPESLTNDRPTFPDLSDDALEESLDSSRALGASFTVLVLGLGANVGLGSVRGMQDEDGEKTADGEVRFHILSVVGRGNGQFIRSFRALLLDCGGVIEHET